MKRNFILFFVATLFLCAFTNIKAQNVLLNETFNSCSTGEIPTGWDNSEGTEYSSYNKWSVQNRNLSVPALDGNYVSFNSCYSYTGNTNCLKTPAVTLSGYYRLKFMFANPTGGDFSVYLSTDGGDTYPVLLESGLSATGWTEKQYDLSAYKDSTVTIVFKSTSNYGSGGYATSYHYLDNVVIDLVPTCKRPIGLNISNVTTTSVYLGWSLDHFGADPASYILTVTDNETGTVVVNETALNAPYRATTITGLTPGTTYTVSLQGDCSASYKGTSEYSPVFTFTTPCNPVALPVTENFDAATSMPDCWSSGLEYPEGVSFSSSYYYGNSGKSICLTPTSTKSAFFATPMLNEDYDNLEIDFYIRPMYTMSTQYQVGIMLDPYDFSTFFPIVTNTTTDAAWRNVRINTGNLPITLNPGQKVCFAIKAETNTYSQAYYIDNVNIHVIPTCPRLENVTISDIDSMSCTVAWTDGATASTYRLRAVNTANQQEIYSTATTNPATFSGLQSGTTYDISVRAICSSTDSSEWSLPTTMMTECGTYVTPIFSESFENGMPACWTVTKDQGSYSQWNVTTPYYPYSCADGTKCVNLGSNYGTVYHSALISKVIRIDAAGKYDAYFHIFRYSGNNPIKDEVVKLWVSSTPDTVGATLLGAINPNITVSPTEATEGWYKYSFPINTTGFNYIIITAGTYPNNGVFVDNIGVEIAPSCRPVANIRSDAVTTNSVTLAWDATADSYVITYSASDGTNAISGQAVSNDNNYTINGLSSGTSYTISGDIYAKCGADSSILKSFSVKATTLCDVISTFPYLATFEDVTFPANCFSTEGYGELVPAQYGPSAVTNWERSTKKPYKGTASAYMKYSFYANPYDYSTTYYHNKANLVLPQFAFNGNTDYQVSWYQYRSANTLDIDYEYVSVYVNNTPDTVNATLLKTVYNAISKAPAVSEAGYYLYTADIPADTAGNKYIIFNAHNKGRTEVYVDNIRVFERPNCSSLFSFSVDSVTKNSVRVNLFDEGVTNWQIGYTVSGNGTENLTTVDANTSVFTLSGLNPDTRYDIYVRNNCGTEYSLWSDEYITVNTYCEPMAITTANPFIEDFETGYAENEVVEGCFIYGNDVQFSAASTYNYQSYPYYTINPYEGGKFGYFSKNNGQLSAFYPVTLQKDSNYYASIHVIGCYGRITNGAKLFISTEPSMDRSKWVEYLDSADVVSGTWTQLKGYFNTKNTGDYYLGIYLDSYPYYGGVSGIDNIKLMQRNCIPPTNVESVTIKSDSVELVITSTATQWEVILHDAVFNPETETTLDFVYDTIINSRNVILNGLTSNKVYYYTVRSIIPATGEVSEWTELGSFTTACAPFAVPFEENFEADNHLNCWNAIGDGKNYFKTNSTYHYRGTKSAALRNSLLVSPKMNVPALVNNYMVSGYAFTLDADSCNLSIGLMTDPNDVGTLTDISDVKIKGKGKWVEFSAVLSFDVNSEDYEYVEFARYFTITSNNASVTIYLDDIELYEIPYCSKPSNFVCTVVTDTSATFEWRANGNETSWNIIVTDENNNVVANETVTSNPAVINGLTGNTVYSAAVAALCSANDTSRYARINSFTTICSALPLPYSNGFENINTNNNIYDELKNDCWFGFQFPDPYTTAYNPQLYSYEKTEGYYSLQLKSHTYAETYLVLPKFDVDLNTCRMLLDYRMENVEVCGDLVVGVITNPADASTFVPVANLTKNNVTVKNAEVNFSVIDADLVNAQIAIRNGRSERERFFTYLDNIRVEYLGNCPAPALMRTDNVTENSAVISFRALGNQWQYIYGEPGFDTLSATPVTVNDTLFTLSNLQSATAYQVYMRNVCEDGNSAWSRPFNFNTTCSAIINAPYKQSFDIVSTPSQACIDVFSFVSGTNPYAEISSESDYAVKGQCLQTYASTDGPLYIALPQLDIPLNQTYVEFSYRSESTYADMYPAPVIGYMTDINNESTFVECSSLPLVNFMTKTLYAFNNVTATNGRVVIKIPTAQRYNGSKNSFDNLTLGNVNSCNSVENIALTNITSDAATFTFDYYPILNDVDSFEYRVLAGDGSVVDIDTITSRMFIADNLEPQTNYTLAVTSICSNNTADPVLFNFKTAPLPIVPPFSDDFNTESGQWTFVNGEQPCQFRIGTQATNTGKSLYIFNTVTEDYSYNSSTTVYAYATMYLEEGTYEFNYSWKANGESNYDYARIFLAGNGVALTPGSVALSCYQNASTQGFIALDGGDQSKLNMNSAWKQERITVDVPASQLYKFVIMWTNDNYGTYQPPLAFDDFSVIKLECPALEEMPEIVSVTHDNAVVKLGNTIGANVEYRLCRTQSETDSIATYFTVNDTVSINGLSQNTPYYLYVRTVCEEATSSWSVLEINTLKTPATVPYFTDFSNADDNALWTMKNNTLQGSNKFYIGAATGAAYVGDNALYISNTGTDLNYSSVNTYASVNHRFTFDAGTYVVRFRYKVGGDNVSDFGRAFLAPDGLQVALDYNTEVKGDRLPAGCIALDNGVRMSNATQWQEMVTTVDIPSSATYALYFYWMNDGWEEINPGLTVDSISITAMSCYTPRISSVVEDVKATFTVTGVDENANVIYTVYKADDRSVIANDTISDREFVVSGLTSVTSYILECYADCGGGDLSFTTTVNFKTRKAATQIPYVTGFEDDADNGMWLFVTDINEINNNSFKIGNATRGVHAGNNGLYVGCSANDYGYTTKWGKTTYAYRPIRLEAGQYYYSYHWAATSASGLTDFGRVFLIPDTVELDYNRVYLSRNTNITHPDVIPMDGDNLASAAGWKSNEGYFVIENAGVYNIVTQWTNRQFYDYNGSSYIYDSGYPLAIDDLTIDTLSCLLSLGASVISVDNNSAEIDLNNSDGRTIELSLSTSDNVASASILDTVTGNTYTLSNLNASTTYTLFMRTICSATEASPYTSLSIQTYCSDIISVTAGNPYIESFENLAGSGASAEQNCWTEDKGAHVNGWKIHNKNSYTGTVNPEAYDGNNFMFLMRTLASEISRPVRLESGKKYEISSMVRMDDKTTKDADGVVYEYFMTKGNERTVIAQYIVNSADYIQVIKEFQVPASGIYNIGVRAAVGAQSEWFIVDYLTIEEINVSRPDNLVVTNITANSADISWDAVTGADEYQVQVYNNKYGMVLDTITGATSATVYSLKPNTAYYINLRAIDNTVSNDTSTWVNGSFRTICGASEFPYIENFNDYSRSFSAPSCWSLYGSSNNLSSNWHVGYGMTAEDGNSLVLSNNILGTAQVMSPEFTTGNEDYIVKFRYSQDMPSRDSLYFRVYEVVDDTTYTLLQQEVLDVKGATLVDKYVVISHPNKNIRFAFTAVVPVNKSSNIYVDDINVNCYYGESVRTAYVCRGNRYVGNGFVVEADKTSDINVNSIELTRLVLGGQNGCDSIVKLQLTVQDAPVIHINDTICKGDVYSKYGFNNLINRGDYTVVHHPAGDGCDTTIILHLEVLNLQTTLTETICEGGSYNFAGQTLTESGVYIDSLTGARGCDSIVTLYLFVMPREIHYSAYICEGGTYTWNDVTYNAAGTYTVNLTNSLGCDSIEILDLKVIPSVTRMEMTMCEGQNYDFYGTTVTTTGEYSHTIVNSLGCDSTIILAMTVTPAPIGRFNDYVCEGVNYESYGFSIDIITQDTVVSRRVNNINGCDSIVEVSIEFIPTVVVDINATINSGEVYEIGGNSLTEAGEYTYTFPSSLGCDSIVNLTLNVVTDVDNAYALPIVVAPNPVVGGQSTFVNRDWSIEEQNGMRVEVLNSVGQVVDVFTPTAFPIEVSGIYTSGVYYIRVTSGTGDIYLGRLIVK